MVVFAAGDVVLVRFPFSDLSRTKVRPAVCLGGAGRGDWLLCQITSNGYEDPRAISLGSADFVAGGLKLASYARPGKLFTANGSLITTSAGRLNDIALRGVIDAVVALLNANRP